jgi:DNA polymerase III delta prime subunit
MDAVLGQTEAVSFLRERLTTPPHLILWGPTGVGKTMLANAWIAEQLTAQGITTPAQQAAMTLRLSSADERGIAAIRQRLTEFVRQRRPVPGTTAWVLFDDADNINGKDHVVVQQALRRIMELNAHQTRFCFIAQSPEHFIEPIQSRCVILQLHPVPLHSHAAVLAAKEAPTAAPTPDALQLMAALCLGNVRQFTLICRALPAGPVSATDIQLLVNAPPVALLQRLQEATICRDIGGITESVLALWSRGYSFEDVIAMLETVVRIYSPLLTDEQQYVLQRCAEGHICQILNKTTTLDLIRVFSN